LQNENGNLKQNLERGKTRLDSLKNEHDIALQEAQVKLETTTQELACKNSELQKAKAK